MTCPPIHIVIAVWGRSYTDLFLEVGLPSLLSEGNLCALRKADGHAIHLITMAQDLETIEQSPVWRKALEVIDIKQTILPKSADLSNPHELMSSCHRTAIEVAGQQDAALLFFNPDIVLADGAMKTLVGILEQGKRAVQVLGPRASKEAVVPLLLRKWSSDDGKCLTITPRELMALAIEHMHPITRMHLYEAEDEDILPQNLFWKVNGGLLGRCFHIHPILVYPRVRNARFATTVDDNFLRAACPNSEDEYVITNSDEFALCELSSTTRSYAGFARLPDGWETSKWAWKHARAHHFEHLTRRFFLHTGDASELEWEEAVAKSDAAVRKILRQVLQLEALQT